MSVYSGFATRH